MEKKQVLIWCNELRDAWIMKNFEKVAHIFSKTTTYFEDPFSPPGTTLDQIKSYWDDIVYQQINELSIKPLVVEDFTAVLHWNVDYNDERDSVKYVMDGIYLVEFNTLVECISFRQWWVVKE